MANSVYEAFFISSECRVVRHLTHLPRLRVVLLDFYKLKLKVKVHVRGGAFTLLRFNRGAHKAGTRVVQVKVTLNSSFVFVTDSDQFDKIIRVRDSDQFDNLVNMIDSTILST